MAKRRIFPQKHGNLYIVAAPSGAGKTSLVKALVENTPDVQVSVSHTTRAARPGEVNGQDYHFVSHDEFEQLISAQAFLEHAKVFDNYYGTAVDTVRGNLAEGKDLILEIDWQGARQVHKVFPNACGIFILPPDLATLRKRLTERGQDSDEVVERRMRDAVQEMEHFNEFNFLVINDDFDQALQDFRSIVFGQRQSLQRQMAKHGDLIKRLLE